TSPAGQGAPVTASNSGRRCSATWDRCSPTAAVHTAFCASAYRVRALQRRAAFPPDRGTDPTALGTTRARRAVGTARTHRGASARISERELTATTYFCEITPAFLRALASHGVRIDCPGNFSVA